MEEMTRVQAIKAYFGRDSRPVTMEELKSLTSEEREELAIGAAKILGVKINVAK